LSKTAALRREAKRGRIMAELAAAEVYGSTGLHKDFGRLRHRLIDRGQLPEG